MSSGKRLGGNYLKNISQDKHMSKPNLLPGYRNKLLLSLFLGFVVYLVLSFYADLERIREAIESFSWQVMPVVLALAFLNYLFRFLKWHFYLSQLGIRLGKKESFWVFMSGLLMSVTPAKAGELLKAYLVKELNGTPISFSAPIVVAERLTDFLAVIVLSAYGVIYFKYGLKTFGISTLIFILLMLVIGNQRLSFGLIDGFSRLPFLTNLMQKIKTAYKSMSTLMAVKPLILTVLISVAAWFSECYAFYLVLSSFQVPASLFQATFIYAFSTLVGAVSMLPGGLVTTEGSMAGLLLLIGMPKNSAVVSVLIIRLCTLWFAVLVGFCALFWGRKMITTARIGNQAEK